MDYSKGIVSVLVIVEYVTVRSETVLLQTGWFEFLNPICVHHVTVIVSG